MMRSESTRALGHPRLTNPTFGWRRLMRGRYGTHRRRFFQREIQFMKNGWQYGAGMVASAHFAVAGTHIYRRPLRLVHAGHRRDVLHRHERRWPGGLRHGAAGTAPATLAGAQHGAAERAAGDG